jgi:hypothetical protein
LWVDGAGGNREESPGTREIPKALMKRAEVWSE